MESTASGQALHKGRSQERPLETVLWVDFYWKRSVFLCLSKASWLIYAYEQVEMFPEPEPLWQLSVYPGSLKSKRIQEAGARRLLVKAEEANREPAARERTWSLERASYGGAGWC